MIADTVKLREDEKMIAVIRRHWFSLAIDGAVNIFIFLVATIAVVIADGVLLSNDTNGETVPFLPISFFALSFIGLLLWMHFFASWSDHWLDAWIITTDRVIDIEQQGFFRRQVSSFPLAKIQDVTYTVSGVIPTWLHFGDVRIQTASISDDFIMRQVPFPEDVKEHLVEVLQRQIERK
jgi:hypothetical protein